MLLKFGLTGLNPTATNFILRDGREYAPDKCLVRFSSGSSRFEVTRAFDIREEGIVSLRSVLAATNECRTTFCWISHEVLVAGAP